MVVHILAVVYFVIAADCEEHPNVISLKNTKLADWVQKNVLNVRKPGGHAKSLM